MVLTQPDRPRGRGLSPKPSAVKTFALAQGLEIFQPESLRTEAALRRVRGASADALVVAAYGMILPEAILGVARYGSINIHASLLPRWRGAAPIQRCLLAGDRETGVCVMKMDAGLDTGPVIARRSIPIEVGEDAGTLHDKLAALGADMIVDAVRSPEGWQPSPQPAEGVTYAHKIKKDEARVDWSQPAEQIERAIRAFRPAPGAFTTLAGENLKLWIARVVSPRGDPGAVLEAGPARLVVACGDRSLELVEVQRPGGRRIAAAEFLRGHPLAPGVRFS